MKTRALMSHPGEAARSVSAQTIPDDDANWLWLDVVLEEDDTVAELEELVAVHGLDPVALSDAVIDIDIPKVDEFPDNILIIFHGLQSTKVETYELDCFLTRQSLVTVRRQPSRSLDEFTRQVQESPELANGGPDELLARIADVVSRRFLDLAILLDRQLDTLVEMALRAAPDFLEELTYLRRDASEVRAILRPQREVFDQLRLSPSPLLSNAGKRRFSDVYDISERSLHEFDSARTTMSEALGAYQGAEARKATEVSKVLTVYAAIMLPLSLIAGFYGMNFANLPTTGSKWGWEFAMLLMVAVAVVSLGIFAAVGWIRPPSARRVGRGLFEATKAPVQVVASLYSHSASPIRNARQRRRASEDHHDEEHYGEDHYPGSE